MHMYQRFFFLFILLTAMTVVHGQSAPVPDSVSAFVSAGNLNDTLEIIPPPPPGTELFRPQISESCIYGPNIGGYLTLHPWFRLDIPVRSWLISPRLRPATDWIFYLFICCLLYIGLMRLLFPRYMGNLFLVFRNVVHRQKQLRDQVAQNALPSLLLNLFFCISGGIFLFFFLGSDLVDGQWPPFRSILSLIVLLMSIGVSKYLLLRLAGWLAGRQKEAESYAFIVFLVNKVTGILLIPVSLMLAYRTDPDRAFWVDIAWILVAALLIVRLIRAYDFVSKELKINILHFFFMILSFEVLPILLVSKALRDHFL